MLCFQSGTTITWLYEWNLGLSVYLHEATEQTLLSVHTSGKCCCIRSVYKKVCPRESGAGVSAASPSSRQERLWSDGEAALWCRMTQHVFWVVKERARQRSHQLEGNDVQFIHLKSGVVVLQQWRKLHEVSVHASSEKVQIHVNLK